LGGFGGVADTLNRYNHYLGTPDYLDKDIQRYRTATQDAVKAFAATYLDPKTRVVVHGVPGQQKLAPDVPAPPAQKAAPGTGAESLNADESWGKAVPTPGPVAAPKRTAPMSFKLANGLTVILAERPNLPIVSMALVVKTGRDANPAERAGLRNFTAR